MKESKLFQILRTFSADEFKEFRKLAASPFFNREGEYILRFVDHLKKYHPAFDSPALDRRQVFKKLYPDKKFDDATIRKLGSVSQKLAEEYLVQKSFSLRKLDKDLLLMNEFTSRNLNALFEKKLASLSEEVHKDETINEDYFENIYRFEREVYHHYLTHPKQHLASEHHIKYGEYFLANSLVRNFNLVQDLNVSRSSHNQFLDKQMVEAYLDNFNYTEMLQYFEALKFDKKYIIDIFYYLVKAHENFLDDAAYFKLKALIMDNFDKFDKNFRTKTLSFFLNNICTEKIRRGKRDFYKEIFENYKIMLEHGLYINPGNNYFHLVIYRAILITAASIEEFDWLKEFIEKYRGTLQPDLRENLINYAYGYLYYYSKDYEKSLTHFNKVKFDIFIFKLDVKNFLLMTYYTLGYIEEAFALIDTYKHFLADNQMISANMNEITINFVNFVAAMLKIQSGKGDRTSAEMLKDKIEKTEIVGFKNWLLEKANELAVSTK